MKPKRILTPLLAFLLLLAAGCAPDAEPIVLEGGTACTEIAVASVTVVVLDEDGAALSGAVVTYTVDGSGELPADQLSGNEFVAGWEVAGTFAITAAKNGYVSAVAEVTVVEDGTGCHVVGQRVEMVLVRAA